MIPDRELEIIVMVARTFKPAWDTFVVRQIVRDLHDSGMRGSEIMKMVWDVAEEPENRSPNSIRWAAQKRKTKPEQDHAFNPQDQVLCNECGMPAKQCATAQKNHAFLKHQFIPALPRAATIGSEERAVVKEDLKRRFPKRTSIFDPPYVPGDQLGDTVAGRATTDDQEPG